MAHAALNSRSCVEAGVCSSAASVGKASAATATPVMVKTTMSDRLSTCSRVAERRQTDRGESNADDPCGHHCSHRQHYVGFRRLSHGHMLDLAAVRAARERITGRVHTTPTLSATRLGERVGVQLVLKCENLQKTGSFKVRGAMNKLSHLTAVERGHGVVTVS